MNKSMIALLTVFIFLGSLAVPGIGGLKGATRSLAPKKPTPKFMAGEVLVKFKKTSASQLISSQQRIAHTFGATKFKKIDSNGLTKVKLRAGQSVEDAVREMAVDSEVDYVQPNFIYKLAAVPDDPQYGQQWALKNTGQTITGPIYGTNNPGTTGFDMGLETAWESINDCSSVIVAVIDTGVNYNHTDLAANMWSDNPAFPNHGYDFIDDDNDPMDISIGGVGHGTHVAGIIGSVGNNGIGSSGVCWKTKIMALRTHNEAGFSTTDVIVSALNFAVAHSAKVINLSIEGPSSSVAEQTAFANALANGVVVVAAAGNSALSNDVTSVFPCMESGVVCVAATDQAGVLATFSNFGLTNVDVAAPGVNILSEEHGTITVSAVEPFTTGWTLPAPWALQANFNGTGTDLISVPATWNIAAGPDYAASTSASAFKTFDFFGVNNAALDFTAIADTESGQDGINVFMQIGTTDPSTTGTVLDSISGTVAETDFHYELVDCLSVNCTIGLKFVSDADATVGKGAAVFEFKTSTLVHTTSAFKLLNGTSMATPLVAGLAAMLFAFNPSYTRADVIEAIESGGTTVPALAATIATGKIASASGSVAFINPPTDITAVVR